MRKIPKPFTHGGITYLHEKLDVPRGERFIWPVPDAFGVRDETLYGLEVLRQRTLRYGRKAYELANYHTALVNSMLAVSAEKRGEWVPHEELYDFMRDPQNDTPPLVPTTLIRTLDALDAMMADASGTNTPFFERSIRGSGNHTKLRLHPTIGIEDKRSPRDFDIPFD